MTRRTIAILMLLTCAIGCAHPSPPIQYAGAQLQIVEWSDLSGWAQDDHALGYATFLASCAAVVTAAASPPKLVAACQRAQARGPLLQASARAFFESTFVPVRITAVGEDDGLITAYYVPVFAVTLEQTLENSAPFYAMPDDLPSLAFTRAEIDNGALAERGLELLWADPIDAFFAQVQGSARVRLPDGSMRKLEYVAKNQYPYTSIGRVLIDRGLVPREEMSMQRIKEWMTANPDAAVELRQQNQSYVFFSARPTEGDEEGRGAQGLPLVPQRSIAVDSKLHAYGTPFFVGAELPIESPEATTRFRHLMVAMDTGSAIVGPARADIYWGVGDAAAQIAGRFKHRGTFTLFMPR